MSVTVKEYEDLLLAYCEARSLLGRVLDAEVGGEAPPDFYHLLNEIKEFLKNA